MSAAIGYINDIGSCIAIWGYIGIYGHSTPSSSPKRPKVFALTADIRPALLDQQPTAHASRGVVEAGGVDRSGLDEAIAPHECAIRASTGEIRPWAFPRRQSLVSRELEVEGETVWVKPTTPVEHVS